MNLNEQIERQLTQLAALPADEHLLSVAVDQGKLECQLTAVDVVGCSFRLLELQTGKLANATVDELKNVSDSLSKRLSYLLEPVGLIEADNEHCIVQMRSNPPQQDDKATSYYELLIRRGGTISLCRFTKEHGGQRQVIPAEVTREVLGRLATDFVDAVA